MKLYDCKAVVNPRRVRMFLAEKGITVDTEQVDLLKGEQNSDAFRSLNPAGVVPCLALDDGTTITESDAIVRYFEGTQPSPALLGDTPAQQAKVTMWQRRVAEGLVDAVTGYFHHATPGLGDAGRYRNAEWGAHNKEKAVETMRWLDRELADRDYVAGDALSYADITALCGIDAAKMFGIEIPDECRNLAAWHGRVSARPSAAA